jgi:hypothetical protein
MGGFSQDIYMLSTATWFWQVTDDFADWSTVRMIQNAIQNERERNEMGRGEQDKQSKMQ